MRRIKSLVLSLLCLSIISCKNNENIDSSSVNKVINMQDVTNALKENHYKEATIKLEVKFNNDTLTSRHDVNYINDSYTVNFEYQELATLSLEGNNDSYIKTTTGEVTFASSTNVEVGNLNSSLITLKDLEFNNDSFVDISLENNIYIANINDLGSLLKLNGTYTEAFVNAKVLDNKVEYICFSYKTDSKYATLLTYEFTY